MSDNLPPEVVQEELEARFRIPTEVWTDVFKLLPRRVLVQKVAPVCYYFKEISDKNVKNVHVIEDANQFTKKLNKDDPEANQQLEQLAGNDCNLAEQFRLVKMWICNEKGQAIPRHCPDLFIGCAIGLNFNEKNKSSPLFVECLSQLEKSEPVLIEVCQCVVIDFWRHPTIQNCNRILFDFWSNLSAATMMTAFENIFEWLHHQPTSTDCDDADHQHVRCMIISSVSKPVHIDWLLDHCSKDIQQAREPIDRRPFVLSLECWDSDWNGFGQFRRIENKSTGEVLTLDRVMNGNGQPTREYRLRRCLTGEESNRQEFYAEMFERDSGYDVFKIDENKPKVTIG